MDIIINVALCEGRHEISQATDGCVYGSIADITDIAKLEEEAVAFIRSHLVCGDTGDTCPCMGSKGLCDEQTRNLGVHKLRNFTVMSSKELSEKLRELKKPFGY